MDPRKLQRIVVDALGDIKAQDIRVFDTTAQTELFDRVIIATGTSNRQTRALAAHVRDKVKQAGVPVISMEGADTGEWVLVDLGDIVVHVMQPAIRQYYNLEEIWGAKPVRLRIGEPAAARATGRTATKRTAADGAPARRAPSAAKSARTADGSGTSAEKRAGSAGKRTASGAKRAASAEKRASSGVKRAAAKTKEAASAKNATAAPKRSTAAAPARRSAAGGNSGSKRTAAARGTATAAKRPASKRASNA